MEFRCLAQFQWDQFKDYEVTKSCLIGFKVLNIIFHFFDRNWKTFGGAVLDIVWKLMYIAGWSIDEFSKQRVFYIFGTGMSDIMESED